jgi:very-short-patch-repair endonuclease
MINNEIRKCKYCDFETTDGRKYGGHLTNCKLNPNWENRSSKCGKANKGKKLSDETKLKISISRKRYLKENPDKVPYLLNHSRKESYPEKYFTQVFENKGLSIKKEHRIGLYALDFCILEKQINIEIDGDQHYLDKKIIASDIRRTKYLEDKGWDVIRIRWSEYQKMDYVSKSKYINDLLLYINELINTKPIIIIEDNRKKCVDCTEPIYKRALRCNQCSGKMNRKVERPSYEQLLQDIEETNYVQTGKKYGVSDNSIRKWIKAYQSDLLHE